MSEFPRITDLLNGILEFRFPELLQVPDFLNEFPNFFNSDSRSSGEFRIPVEFSQIPESSLVFSFSFPHAHQTPF